MSIENDVEALFERVQQLEKLVSVLATANTLILACLPIVPPPESLDFAGHAKRISDAMFMSLGVMHTLGAKLDKRLTNVMEAYLKENER